MVPSRGTTTEVPIGSSAPLLESASEMQMGAFPKCVLAIGLLAGGVLPSHAAVGPGPNSATSIESVTVLGKGNSVEVEIAASGTVTPRTQVLTGPDRLIIDFPNSAPAAGLRKISINRGGVKGVRVGLFSSSPSVTRIVVDLQAPQTYQIVPSGKMIAVKFNGDGKQTASMAVQATAVSSVPPPAPVKPVPRVEVSFQNGKLSLWANGATLAEVLFEVHRRTGADIPIPSGAEQEQVFANYGPAPARDVLASLLNGSRFNFVLVASERDPAQLRSVLLIPRGADTPPPVNYSQPATVARALPQPEPTVEPDAVQDPPTADEPPPQPQQQPQPPQ
jgi:hypothetical protein